MQSTGKKGVFYIKKLTLFSLLILTVLVLTGCNTHSNRDVSAAGNAIEYLEKANAAMNDIDSMLITFISETSMPFVGSDLVINAENIGTIETINTASSFEARIELMQEIMGSQIEYVVYFKDDIVAITDLPEDMGVDGVRGMAQHETPFSLINIHLDFLEDAILDHDYEIVDEGVWLRFSLDGEALLRTINGQLNMEDFTFDHLGENHYYLVILLDPSTNLIQSLDLDIGFIYGTEDGEFEASMQASLEVQEDNDVSFGFPDNLDEFIDIGIIHIPPF